MKEILTRNLGLKIVSVVIAFFVWIAVVNVSDPQVTGRQEIMLDVINEDVMTKAGLAYEIEGKRTSVSISYLVHTQDRVNLAASDFRAYINLADYYPATGTVPVYVEVLNNKSYLVESVAAKPAVVRIKTEEIQKKDFDLRINPVGTQAEGYEVQSYELDHDMVTVEGPESAIGRISSVGIEVDIEGLSADTVRTVTPIFYDANHNELPLDERVTVNIPEISCTVKMMKIKKMQLEFEVGGRAADGFRYMGVESTATEVSVVGVDAVVSQVDSIKIPSSVLNLGGAAEDKVITVDVEDYLPDQGNMSIPWNSQVTITLKVRKLETRKLEIPTNRIIREGELDEYYYDYDQDSIEVTVEGLPEDLETLDVADLILEMDVSRMEAGSHRAVLNIESLHEDCEAAGYSDFRVLVSPKEAGPGGSASSAGESHQEGSGFSQEETSASHSANEESEAPAVEAGVSGGTGLEGGSSEHNTEETRQTGGDGQWAVPATEG